MVQVISDPYKGNIFGRLGKGIGKGLSEQVPKEIERLRLSAGLKKFEKESKGLTPVQQFTRLAAIPGITPEHLYTLSPLLRQQAQREEGERPLSQAGEQSISAQGRPQQIAQAVGQEIPGQIPFAEAGQNAAAQSGLKSLEETKAQLTPIVRKSRIPWTRFVPSFAFLNSKTRSGILMSIFSLI
jgi:hypothetical protein